MNRPVNVASNLEKIWHRTLREIPACSQSANPRDWLSRIVTERTAFYHTLPCTVCERGGKGVEFTREEIEVAVHADEPARLVAYRISPSPVDQARRLIGEFRENTGTHLVAQ